MRTYWGLKDIAREIGVQERTVSTYDLPEPDAMIGNRRGWLPETIRTWQAARPGPGARTDLTTPRAERRDDDAAGGSHDGDD